MQLAISKNSTNIISWQEPALSKFNLMSVNGIIQYRKRDPLKVVIASFSFAKNSLWFTTKNSEPEMEIIHESTRGGGSFQ